MSKFMTYEQILQLMSETVQNLSLEIDLSDYISRENFSVVLKEFELELAKKVDTETYTQTMRKIESSISKIKEDIFPIDLSTEDTISGILDVEHGGTNGSNATEAQYNLLKDLDLKTTDLEDATCFLYSKPVQSKESGSIGKVQVDKIWDWMKDKIKDDGISSETTAISNEEIDGIF